jgi:hypothetical protein
MNMLPHEGPALPPMTEHLSKTPIENIQNLLVHIIANGIGDENWVHTPDFEMYCFYAGMDRPHVRRIREMTVAGTLNARHVAATFWGA